MSNLSKYYGGNTMLDDFFDLDRFFGNRYGTETVSKLRTHVEETDEAHVVKAEVPGLSDDDIDISFENDTLSVVVDYKEESKNALRTGRYQAAWTFRDVDPEKVDADMQNGLLIVTLPKTEKAKPRKITIKR